MKRTWLLLLVFILIFPMVVRAYEINKSYKKANEDLLNGVDCIGVDTQDNVYLMNFLFKTIQVYTNKGEFLYSVKVPTTGTFYFKIDNYIWVAVARTDKLLKYSLDGYLLEETGIDLKEFKEDIEYKYVTKDSITYRIRGALGIYSVWREQDGSIEKMFNLSIKHMFVNILFLIIIVAFAVAIPLYIITGRKLQKLKDSKSILATSNIIACNIFDMFCK